MASKAYPHCSKFQKYSCFNRGETSWEDYNELSKLIDCKEVSGLGYWEPHSINIVHYLLHLHHWFLIIFIYVSLFECMGTCGYGGHACAWTWKSEEGIGRSIPLLYACTLRKCLFLDLGLEPLKDQQVPGSHPVSVWLWAGITGFLWGILYSLNHEYLDLNSGLQKFGASVLQLWTISPVPSSFLLLSNFVLQVHLSTIHLLLYSWHMINHIFALRIDCYKPYA